MALGIVGCALWSIIVRLWIGSSTSQGEPVHADIDPPVPGGAVRWSHFVGQSGGMVKVEDDCVR